MAKGLVHKLSVKKNSQTSRLVGRRLAVAPRFNSAVVGEIGPRYSVRTRVVGSVV